MQLPQIVDFPGFLVESALQLLFEPCSFLLQLLVESCNLVVGSFLVDATQLLCLSQLLLCVLQVLRSQLEVFGEVLVGLVAVVQLVLQLLDLPEQLLNTGLQLLLLGLSDLGVLLVLVEELFDFDVVGGLELLDVAVLILFLLLEHLAVHVDLQSERLLDGVDLGLQLSDLLLLHRAL